MSSSKTASDSTKETSKLDEIQAKIDKGVVQTPEEIEAEKRQKLEKEEKLKKLVAETIASLEEKEDEGVESKKASEEDVMVPEEALAMPSLREVSIEEEFAIYLKIHNKMKKTLKDVKKISDLYYSKGGLLNAQRYFEASTLLNRLIDEHSNARQRFSTACNISVRHNIDEIGRMDVDAATAINADNLPYIHTSNSKIVDKKERKLLTEAVVALYEDEMAQKNSPIRVAILDKTWLDNTADTRAFFSFKRAPLPEWFVKKYQCTWQIHGSQNKTADDKAYVGKVETLLKKLSAAPK